MPFIIRRALISVSDKTGLLPIAQALKDRKVEIVSTGGTAAYLQKHNIDVTMVATLTGFPEIMDGRVKTLHPKVHGGLLARRDLPEHMAAMKEHGIPSFDLVLVNLYPFEATVASGADFADCVENIDVGGPAMIRAAAKNYEFVMTLTDPKDYPYLIDNLDKQENLNKDLRRDYAQKAFEHTAAYDAAIAQWFAGQAQIKFPEHFFLKGDLVQSLRYGENPHQAAALYRDGTGNGLPQARFLQGKELSYNNLADGDAALSLLHEFLEPAAIIVKHANPCGVAIAASIEEAYRKALAADPVSAFGGIVALNHPVGDILAQELSKLFLEVIIAPDFTSEALRILSAKKNLRLLALPMEEKQSPRLNIKRIAGGFLVQESDGSYFPDDAADIKLVTKRDIEQKEMNDLLFANKIVKHVSSNAIVVAKDGQSLGVGAGQMSRIDAVRIALEKAGQKAEGAVLASDAFFPFPDNIEAAAAAGIKAIIQPGGSQKDTEVIAACDQHGLAMVFTGRRHFRH